MARVRTAAGTGLVLLLSVALAPAAPDANATVDAGVPPDAGGTCKGDPRWAKLVRTRHFPEIARARRERARAKARFAKCKQPDPRNGTFVHVTLAQADGSLPPEAIRLTLRHNFGHFRLCRDPIGGPSRSFEGSAILGMCIDASGRLGGVAILQTDLPRDAAECLSRAFEKPVLRFQVAGAPGPSFVQVHVDIGARRNCYSTNGRGRL